MKTFRILCLAPVIFFALVHLNAQTSVLVTGTITDAVTGKPLHGAAISLKGTDFGASSRHDGRFELSGMKEGSYTIVVSFIGYNTVEKRILTAEGQSLVLDFALKTAVIKFNNITVEAEKAYSSASSRAVRQLDMILKPTRSAQDLLQLAPGLIIAQHAG